MERMSIENRKGILYKEHTQRYDFIKPLVYGNVLDIACGVGYGSEIIIKVANQYLGMDFSDEAIGDAKKYYEFIDGVTFQQGDIQNLKLDDNIFDTILSFETLEHLSTPEKALEEIHRVLKTDGILIGSVPSKEYDDICEQVYGKNEYHLSRFSMEKLQSVLKLKFKYVEFYINELIIYNTFKNLINSDRKSFITTIKNSNNDGIYGSIIFIVSNDKKRFLEAKSKISNHTFQVKKLVEYDKEKEFPLRKTIFDQEIMINERDKTINAQALMIDERDKTIYAQAAMIDERDKYIKKLESRLNG